MHSTSIVRDVDCNQIAQLSTYDSDARTLTSLGGHVECMVAKNGAFYDKYIII